MDLLLGPFADNALSELSDPELELYEEMLTENDQELYAWAAGREPPPERFASLIDRVTAHAAGTFAQQSDVS